MAFETIVLTKKNRVATIRLNRPEAMNAVNDTMWLELVAALDEVAHDSESRVLVLTGNGRAFCGGADLKGGSGGVRLGLAGERIEGLRQWLRDVAQEPTRRLIKMDKPTIAMVNGVAVGAGFDWALCCDIRVGCEESRFVVAYTRVGAAVGTGGLWLLPRLIGVARSLELIYTGRPVSGKEAEKIGLLNMVVPLPELEEKTIGLAEKIAKGPPIALALDKRALYDGLETSLERSLEMAASVEGMTLATEDHEEGVKAFIERREPFFQGK